MRSSGLLCLAASLSAVTGQYTGFNYGATNADGYSVRTQAQFQTLFAAAKKLVGTNGAFTAARLYTTVQAGTAADPTGAIPAAIAEGTHLLLGLWASGPIENELTALKQAIAQYGTAFTSLVAGISVGSEDLYRASPMGIAAKSNIGAEPATVVDYIKQVRKLIAGTGLSGVPVGHVDTWTAWVNGSNQAVIDNCDFVGVDAYPYFQDTQSNGIENSAALFQDAITATQNAVGGKEIWVTETGWPVSGKTRNLAVADATNAKKYWDAVGCPRFGKVNMFWYTLEDTDGGASPVESFGVAPGNPISSTPLYDLSCAAISSSSSSSSKTASSTATSASSGSASASTTTAISVGASSASIASSASAAATDVVSSGGALGPSKGPGSGYGSGSNATVTAVPTGTGSTGNATGLSTTLKPTGSSTATGTGSQSSATSVNNSGASVVSVSGLMAAIFAALAFL